MSVLPGQYAAGFLGPAVPLLAPLTLTVVTTAAVTTASNILPAGIQANDAIVIWEASANNIGGAAPVTPTGFTQILNISGASQNSCRGIASVKIAVGNESGTQAGGMNGGVFNNKLTYVFRGNRPILTVTAAGILTNNGADGDPAAITIPSGAGTPTLIVFGAFGSKGGNTTTGRTFSPAPDQTLAASNAAALLQKVFTSSPQNVTIDMGNPGNGPLLAGFYLQLTG